MTEKIIYEPHPVTPERKKELREKGYKIIDAQFDPEPKTAKAAPDDAIKGMTVKDLHKFLEDNGVKFETDANKQALVDLARTVETKKDGQ